MENQSRRTNYGTTVTVHVRGPIQVRCVDQMRGPERWYDIGFMNDRVLFGVLKCGSFTREGCCL